MRRPLFQLRSSTTASCSPCQNQMLHTPRHPHTPCTGSLVCLCALLPADCVQRRGEYLGAGTQPPQCAWADAAPAEARLPAWPHPSLVAKTLQSSLSWWSAWGKGACPSTSELRGRFAVCRHLRRPRAAAGRTVKCTAPLTGAHQRQLESRSSLVRQLPGWPLQATRGTQPPHPLVCSGS